MKSMTAYAEIHQPLTAGQLRLSLRSVNHKALDLNVRLPVALFPLETAVRAQVREAASRGKLDLTLEVQDEPGLEPQLNRALLRSLAKAWQQDAEWLTLPPLTADAFFRLPGAFLPPASDLAERLEGAVKEGLAKLLAAWDAGRRQEGERLRPFFTDSLAELRRIRAELEREAAEQAQELPEQLKKRLEQLLQEAQLEGQLPAERLVAEAGLLADRQDVREEMVRLASHFEDFEQRLAKGTLSGKWLDVWGQEVLREFNTTGSKCKRLAMTKLVMAAKGTLEQVREQAANLE